MIHQAGVLAVEVTGAVAAAVVAADVAEAINQ